jgi:hypothetical protein
MSSRLDHVREGFSEVAEARTEQIGQVQTGRSAPKIPQVRFICKRLGNEQSRFFRMSIAKISDLFQMFIESTVTNRIKATINYMFPIDHKEKEELSVLNVVNFGGAEGARTPYLLNANQALSQLSYSPIDEL